MMGGQLNWNAPWMDLHLIKFWALQPGKNPLVYVVLRPLESGQVYRQATWKEPGVLLKSLETFKRHIYY
jgi:hypothetical protein